MEVVPVNGHPLLAGDEGPAVPHLQQERLHVTDDRILQVAFQSRVMEVEELKKVRIPEAVGGHH